MAATGVLRGKHRRALDSTVLDDAVATQDTVTQLIAAVRRVIREVPGAPGVAAVQCTAHDYGDPGKPKIAWDDEQARAVLVDALVTDALNLLAHLPGQQLGEQAADAVGLLALVAGQDVEPAEGSDGSDGRWRIAQRTAPDRVVSAVDPDARHIHKNRTRHQDGFKGARVFRARDRAVHRRRADRGQRAGQSRGRGRGPPAGRRGRGVNRPGRYRLRHRRACASTSRQAATRR